jgi:hypothetical protein
MKNIQISGAGKFVAGVVVGAILFSSSAIAINNYVSDNTPENGYLLCANQKTKVVTFPNKLSCPSGTKALDLGAVTGIEGPQGPQGVKGDTGATGIPGPKGDAQLASRPIKAATTFSNVGLFASPNRYSAVLPVRSSMFIAGKTWYRLEVSMRNYSPKVSGQLNCQIMPMDSFSGDQRSGTTVNSSFILFSGYQSTQSFGGEFIYGGGDYVLACKTDADLYVSATVKVQQSDAVDYVG